MNLARLRIVIRDGSGNGVSGVSCEVRKQGASTVGSQSGSPQTVDAVGGIVVGDDIVVGTGTATRNVSAISGTTVTCGVGFNTVDDDRLSPTTNLPSLFVDVAGNEAQANPGTTDSTGTFVCYVVGGFYDIKTSGGGTTTTLHQNIGTEGVESFRSNVYSGTAFQFDSLRALGVADEALVISENSDTGDLFRVMGDGEIRAGVAGATHTLVGTLTADGITSTTTVASTTTMTAGTGLTATTGNVTATAGDLVATAGGVTATSGLINARRYGGTGGTAIVAGDFAIGGGFGTTASISNVKSGSDDTRGAVQVSSSGTGQSANPSIVLTFKDGTYTSVPFAVACFDTGLTSPLTGAAPWGTQAGATTLTLTYFGTPVAGQSYGVSWWCVK